MQVALWRADRVGHGLHEGSIVFFFRAGVKLDLSDVQAIEVFVKAFREKHKTLSVLIHNAAAIRDHTLKNMTEEVKTKEEVTKIIKDISNTEKINIDDKAIETIRRYMDFDKALKEGKGPDHFNA